MKLAISVEVPISEFWGMTPYELNLIADRYIDKQKEENQKLLIHAYYISRWVWQKKIDIESYLKLDKKKETMTDEEMLRQVKILNTVFGGDVKEK